MFRAWDAELQREVALKLLQDDGVSGDARSNARLLQEARRLARIRHPQVVQVYGAKRLTICARRGLRTKDGCSRASAIRT